MDKGFWYLQSPELIRHQRTPVQQSYLTEEKNEARWEISGSQPVVPTSTTQRISLHSKPIYSLSLHARLCARH